MNAPNTILLIDDDLTTNLLNKYFAEAIDDTIDVVTVSNGKEALDFFKNNDIEAIGPCFVVLDVMMPVMNAWEFLETFNQIFDAKFKEQVTISLLTGMDSEGIAYKAKNFPLVNEVIQKPLSEDKFRALLDKHYALDLSE